MVAFGIQQDLEVGLGSVDVESLVKIRLSSTVATALCCCVAPLGPQVVCSYWSDTISTRFDDDIDKITSQAPRRIFRGSVNGRAEETGDILRLPRQESI